jgi:predicted lysophospholipase L1 biosynthesis ABC-type transport system permease subunit
MGSTVRPLAAGLMEVAAATPRQRQIPVDEREDMMYAFAMMALLGLAVLAVAAVVGRYLSMAAEVRAFMLAALGVGAAWLINLDLFGVLAVATRGGAIGVTVTGLMIGGTAYFWQEILGFFAGLTRKLGDEAATLEKSEQLRRVA